MVVAQVVDLSESPIRTISVLSKDEQTSPHSVRACEEAVTRQAVAQLVNGAGERGEGLREVPRTRSVRRVNSTC